MKLNTILKSIMMMLVLVLCTACPDDPILSVSTNVLDFSSDGGSQKISINANKEAGTWTVTANKDWISVFPNQGNGNNDISVTVRENNEEERDGILTINSGAGIQQVRVTQKAPSAPQPPIGKSEIKVSPSVELLGEEKSTTTITVSATANTVWNISGGPEWLSFNKSGLGSTSVVITATKENFSDEPREAKLTFTTEDGSASATCIVSQKGVLATHCKVSVGDITIMRDGFAADLQFDSDCKGYREAFFTPSALADLNDRDRFNLLMQKTEYPERSDLTFSPMVSPGTEIVYCVAAYGSDSNPDGSHKYGPMTIKRITTLYNQTLASDLYLTSSYTSTTWKVITSRSGQFGQKVDQYYAIGFEGEDAALAMYFSDALLAHVYFKPEIKAKNYYNGPQTHTYKRSNDQFFFATWGIDRETGSFSNELQWDYIDLAKSKKRVMSRRDYNSTMKEKKYHKKSDLPKAIKF